MTTRPPGRQSRHEPSPQIPRLSDALPLERLGLISVQAHVPVQGGRDWADHWTHPVPDGQPLQVTLTCQAGDALSVPHGLDADVASLIEADFQRLSFQRLPFQRLPAGEDTQTFTLASLLRGLNVQPDPARHCTLEDLRVSLQRLSTAVYHLSVVRGTHRETETFRALEVYSGAPLDTQPTDAGLNVLLGRPLRARLARPGARVFTPADLQHECPDVSTEARGLLRVLCQLKSGSRHTSTVTVSVTEQGRAARVLDAGDLRAAQSVLA